MFFLREKVTWLLALTLGAVVNGFSGAEHYETLERLQSNLFINYSRNIIPQKERNVPVVVRFDIALNQIIDLDERLQTITTIVWVRLYWKDFRLQWNHSDYGGIESFVTSSKKLWLPDITLYNNANDNYVKEKEEYYGLTVARNGNIGWFYPTIFKSSCTIDVTYFPFDDQKCTLKFGSWSYHGLALDIFHRGSGDTKSFTDNGEWILIAMPSMKHVTRYRCCPEPYPFITYDIIIRRRTMYYILNFLTPCVLMSALTILGFCLPVESGERMNVGVTVLLSLTVILLLLAENLPATSEVVPLISRYYTLTMVNVFVSLVFTCVVLTFYYHAPTPVPAWIQLIICRWCASLFRVLQNEDDPCAEKKQNLLNFIKRRRLSTGNNLCVEETIDPVLQMNNINGNIERDSCTLHNISRRSSESKNLHLRKRCSQSGKTEEGLEILIERTKKDDEKEQYREQWRFAAKVLNRMFMCIVLILVVSNLLSIMLSAPRKSIVSG